jgi:lipooligosaccharide transport system ATP-binding protein
VILILDEPTTGLDPQARHLVWQKLRSLKARGITMLLTTHYMDEAARLCDRIVILYKGKIIAEGTPDELIGSHAGKEVIEVHGPIEDRVAVMARLNGAPDVSVEEVEDILYVYVRGDNGFDPASLKLEADRVVFRRANLEDVFLRLTGRGLAEE